MTHGMGDFYCVGLGGGGASHGPFAAKRRPRWKCCAQHGRGIPSFRPTLARSLSRVARRRASLSLVHIAPARRAVALTPSSVPLHCLVVSAPRERGELRGRGPMRALPRTDFVTCRSRRRANLHSHCRVGDRIHAPASGFGDGACDHVCSVCICVRASCRRRPSLCLLTGVHRLDWRAMFPTPDHRRHTVVMA